MRRRAKEVSVCFDMLYHLLLRALMLTCVFGP